MKLMKTVLLPLAAIVATAGLAIANPATRTPEPDVKALRALSDTFVDVAAKVKPSVVSVHAEKVVKFRQPQWQSPFGEDSPFRWFFDQGDQPRQTPRQREFQFRQGGLGSGIIVDKQGHILTNNHVVRDVDEIKVTLADKRTFSAEIVGTDPKTDLAIIKIKDKVPKDLPVAELGDSDALRVGDWVLAIGAPFGYEHTVTAGICSAKSRSNVGAADFEDFIQTDAAINPGNSGGPLVDLDGKVVGINTVIATSIGQSAGVGFAIPVNMVKSVMPTLVKGGKVSRGQLGVLIQSLNEDLADQFQLPDTKGALVTQVLKDSPADKAGMKPGDVIVRVAGKRVEDTQHLRNLVAATAPGTRVEVVVMRDGKERSFKTKLGELGGEEETTASNEEQPTGKLGLAVAPLTDDQAKELGYENASGVLVRDVEDGSPAATAGIEPGDLITEVNRTKVTSPAEFKEAVEKAKGKDTILMLVKRKDTSTFVIVRQK